MGSVYLSFDRQNSTITDELYTRVSCLNVWAMMWWCGDDCTMTMKRWYRRPIASLRRHHHRSIVRDDAISLIVGYIDKDRTKSIYIPDSYIVFESWLWLCYLSYVDTLLVIIIIIVLLNIKGKYVGLCHKLSWNQQYPHRWAPEFTRCTISSRSETATVNTHGKICDQIYPTFKPVMWNEVRIYMCFIFLPKGSFCDRSQLDQNNFRHSALHFH